MVFLWKSWNGPEWKDIMFASSMVYISLLVLQLTLGRIVLSYIPKGITEWFYNLKNHNETLFTKLIPEILIDHLLKSWRGFRLSANVREKSRKVRKLQSHHAEANNAHRSESSYIKNKRKQPSGESKAGCSRGDLQSQHIISSFRRIKDWRLSQV